MANREPREPRDLGSAFRKAIASLRGTSESNEPAAAEPVK
jgi:hypothetical protein